MIDSLKKGTKEAVQHMNKGRSQARSSINKAEQASRSLNAITQAVSIIQGYFAANSKRLNTANTCY